MIDRLCRRGVKIGGLCLCPPPDRGACEHEEEKVSTFCGIFLLGLIWLLNPYPVRPYHKLQRGSGAAVHAAGPLNTQHVIERCQQAFPPILWCLADASWCAPAGECRLNQRLWTLGGRLRFPARLLKWLRAAGRAGCVALLFHAWAMNLRFESWATCQPEGLDGHL